MVVRVPDDLSIFRVSHAKDSTSEDAESDVAD